MLVWLMVMLAALVGLFYLLSGQDNLCPRSRAVNSRFWPSLAD